MPALTGPRQRTTRYDLCITAGFVERDPTAEYVDLMRQFSDDELNRSPALIVVAAKSTNGFAVVSLPERR